MRECDSVRVADLIQRGIQNIGHNGTHPHMAYMILTSDAPAYIYKYYNVRSRHLRLVELFFVLHRGNRDDIHAVLSVSNVVHRKCYLKILVFDSTLLDVTDGSGLPWFMNQAMTELSRFVDVDAIRFVLSKQGGSTEPVGPHISPAFLAALSSCGFRQIAKLESEGGQDIDLEIYERPISKED